MGSHRNGRTWPGTKPLTRAGSASDDKKNPDRDGREGRFYSRRCRQCAAMDGHYRTALPTLPRQVTAEVLGHGEGWLARVRVGKAQVESTRNALDRFVCEWAALEDDDLAFVRLRVDDPHA